MVGSEIFIWTKLMYIKKKRLILIALPSCDVLLEKGESRAGNTPFSAGSLPAWKGCSGVGTDWSRQRAEKMCVIPAGHVN